MAEAIRVDQMLSRFGYCSRREAASWVAAGRVHQAGQPVTRVESRVSPETITVDGQPVDFPRGLLIVLHKPLGYACSHDPSESPLVYDLLPPRWNRRHPGPITVGRLDRETTGLLLITDDGALCHRLTSPRHAVEKCYEVTTEVPIPEGMETIFGSGNLLLKGESKPCLPARLERTGSHTARLYLSEGRYHQVRRMFASHGAPVASLHRSQLGKLTLDGLAAGAWRPVEQSEIG